MREKATSLCTAVGSILLIIALLILSIEMFAVNPGFFEAEYEKLGTAESIGISEEELTVVTENLIDYTTGERDSPPPPPPGHAGGD